MKKLISLALVVMMICTLSVASFAAEVTTNVIATSKDAIRRYDLGNSGDEDNIQSGWPASVNLGSTATGVTFWGWVASATPLVKYTYTVDGGTPVDVARTEAADIMAHATNNVPGAVDGCRALIEIPLTAGDTYAIVINAVYESGSEQLYSGTVTIAAPDGASAAFGEADLTYDFNNAADAANVELFGQDCEIATDAGTGSSKALCLYNDAGGLYDNGAKIKFTSEYTNKAIVKLSFLCPDQPYGGRDYALLYKTNDGDYSVNLLENASGTANDTYIEIDVVEGENTLYLVQAVSNGTSGNSWRICVMNAAFDLPAENASTGDAGSGDAGSGDAGSGDVFVPAENVTIDLSTIDGATDSYGPHGYPGAYGVMFDYGININLGNYDLSKYESIKITYATDANFVAKHDQMTEPSFFAVTNGKVSGGVGQGNTGVQNADKILARGVCTDADNSANPAGINWDKNERTATIDLTNVDANGDIYLYHYNSQGNQALVTGIRLIAIEADGGNADDGADNPETSDISVVIIAAVAAFALAGVVVCKKVRA